MKMCAKHPENVFLCIEEFPNDQYNDAQEEPITESLESQFHASELAKFYATISIEEESETEEVDPMINVFITKFFDDLVRSVVRFQSILNCDRYIRRVVNKIYTKKPESAIIILQFIAKILSKKRRFLFLMSLFEELMVNKDLGITASFISALDEIIQSTDFENFGEFDQRTACTMLNVMEMLLEIT